ncbi:transposase [Enterocloster clostridioformis]|uniref:transposase n=1 Tax=Enterocloster clostridioformis TaxID=1531 RepID=UPI0012F506B6|nr:transposase [Enterocloster clostridioformis]
MFQTFIQGLLSPLERKSIEPVALHFSGEKYVRPLQRFFTRSPFDKQPLLDTYQELLSRQIGAGCGMLSVGDTSFVKKREAFRRCKTAVLWLPGENGKLPVRGVPCLHR